MVCHRCILATEDILRKLSIPFQQVTIGEIHLLGKITPEEIDLLSAALYKTGLELIDNRTRGIIEKIKQLVLKQARKEFDAKEPRIKLSVYLSEQLHHEYTYLSSLFSSIEGRTIENYFIEQRVEKVKELLVYKEMTLSEIAFELDYSSASHLSSQFKKITGLTPSHFKHVESHRRKLLDQV